MTKVTWQKKFQKKNSKDNVFPLVYCSLINIDYTLSNDGKSLYINDYYFHITEEIVSKLESDFF